MSIETVRASVKSGVWRGIARSGADLSSVAPEQQNQLVDSVTDSVLLAVNEILEEAQKTSRPVAADLDNEEKLLWEGRPFLSLVEFYTLTNERIKLVKGMFGKDIQNLELIRVQDIDVTQNMSERIFDVGDILIRGADPSMPCAISRSRKKFTNKSGGHGWLLASGTGCSSAKRCNRRRYFTTRG